jgi:hypothetical protein
MPEISEIPEELPPADEAAVIDEAASASDGTPETASVPETTKEHAPMLDVHPAHHAASTWKDFFIHIATIVIGLLIAVGLEQVVELIHHHNQVVGAREALRDEQTANEQLFARRTKTFQSETGKFQANLAVLLFLQKHPGAPSAQWPGTVNWHTLGGRFNDSSWATVGRSNVTDLLPQAEVRCADRLYKDLAAEDATQAQRLDAIRQARRYMVVDYDPSHLPPPNSRRRSNSPRMSLPCSTGSVAKCAISILSTRRLRPHPPRRSWSTSCTNPTNSPHCRPSRIPHVARLILYPDPDADPESIPAALEGLKSPDFTNCP